MQDLVNRILQAKKQRDAVILAHLYQPPEIQDIADFVGDSYELSRLARDSQNSTIVFCGVHFMAESAKILSPHKTVLLPNLDAGCPMANMVTAEDIMALRKAHPNAAVVCYVNSSAEVKAHCDICCTSSSAIRIVKSLKETEIIFVPDQNLGHYVSRFVPEKTFILFPGFCPTHNRITPTDVKSARMIYPQVPVLVHPECTPEVVDLADVVGSTAQIIDYCEKSPLAEFIIGTESGILHPLQKRCPTKQFHMLTDHFICPNMKKISLQCLLESLEKNQFEISLPEKIIEQAAISLSRMLSV